MTDPAIDAARGLTEGMAALSAEFKAERQANEAKLGALGMVVARMRRLARWVLIGVALDICLTIAVGVGYGYVHAAAVKATAATSAGRVAARAAFSQCLSTNVDRAATINLWTHVLGISTPKTPTEAKQAEDFRTYLNDNFAPLDCGESPILGPYAVQTVTNRVVGTDGPAMHYGETAVIEGTLCNRTAASVPVLTTLNWQAVGHAGTFVNIATDIAQTRKPGCESFVGANAFHNPMPQTVVAAAKSLGPTAQWVISGSEIPVLPNGSHGKPQSFTSEPFVILP